MKTCAVSYPNMAWQPPRASEASAKYTSMHVEGRDTEKTKGGEGGVVEVVSENIKLRFLGTRLLGSDRAGFQILPVAFSCQVTQYNKSNFY